LGALADPVVIEIEKAFPGGPRVECSLELPADSASVTILFGPSGAGKTTVLRCVAGLERPDRGAIRFGDETWFDSDRGIDLPPQRRRAGLLFQDYALFPHLSVAANVGYGLGALPEAARRQRVADTLALLRLESLADRRPGQLWGGEKQRVALGRALAPRPRVLLLDEPLSALDAPTRETLRGELRRLLAGLAQPTLLVTHDRIEALALGDRMAVMSEGRLRQVGSIEDVFSRPANLEVARAVGVETVLNARVVDRHADGLVTIQIGQVRVSAIDPGGVDGVVFACIRAEEVILERGHPGQVSARNRLEGTVSSVTPEGPLVRIVLDCGFALAALVTRQACRDLDIKEGERLTAFVKSPSVHLIARGAA
jgi:molybdate transport system ATP-binding protein